MKRFFAFIFIIIFSIWSIFSQENENAEVEPEVKDNYFSIGQSLGITIPLGDVGSVMDPGYAITLFFSYNINFKWGILSFGICTGAFSETSNNKVDYAYNLNSFPFSINAKYSTNFIRPLYGFVELNSGMSLNIINYRLRSVHELNKETFALKFFSAPSIGLGYCIADYVSVSL